jgi:hypothetical protein
MNYVTFNYVHCTAEIKQHNISNSAREIWSCLAVLTHKCIQIIKYLTDKHIILYCTHLSVYTDAVNVKHDLGRGQRVLNYIQRTKLSRCRMIRLLPHPLPPLTTESCLSFLVFMCVADRASWRDMGGRGGQGTESYDREKAWPSINYSILSGPRPMILIKNGVLNLLHVHWGRRQALNRVCIIAGRQH